MIGLTKDWTTNHTFDTFCERKYKFSEWMRAKFVSHQKLGKSGTSTVGDKLIQLTVNRELVFVGKMGMLELDRATLMISTTLSIGLGIAIGWALRGRTSAAKVLKKAFWEDLSDGIQAMADTGEVKLVLVVNNELRMGKGKIAAQCAHAAVGAVECVSRQDPNTFKQWRLHGQPKVVVKADDTAMLKELGQKAHSVGLVSCLIADAGRTQIAAGSKTVLGVGPGPAALVDQVTGHLKLL